MPNNARDRAGTSRDKQGQGRDKQGQGRYKQVQTGTTPFCLCLYGLVPVCLCLSLSVPVCPCLSLSVIVSTCVSLYVYTFAIPAILPLQMIFTVFVSVNIVKVTLLAKATVQMHPCVYLLQFSLILIFLPQ